MASDVPTFPISLVVKGRPCLVVGGHERARWKVEMLCASGAEVTVVAPDVMDAIRQFPVHIEKRPYASGEVANFTIAIAATGIEGVDYAVAADGKQAGVLVNVVDDRSASAFIIPATFRQGDVTVAIGTGGKSPAFSSWLRNTLQEAAGPDVGEVLDIVAQVRTELRASGRSSEGRDWHSLIDVVVATLRSDGRDAAIRRANEIASPWFTDSSTP